MIEQNAAMQASEEAIRNNPTPTEQGQERLFAILDELGIAYETHHHPSVFTVAESQALIGDIAGGHTKNLFLKDKKDNYFLISLEDKAEIDLKTIHKVIGAASRVSFGKPEKLMEYLGVIPGSVTLLGVVNDRGGRVRVVIDAALLDHAVINAHPLSNDATTSIRREDLLRFLEATGHKPVILKLSA